MTVYKRKNILNINGRLIRRGFDDIGLIVEVAVIFRIDKGNASRRILPVFQCFDGGYAATVTSKTANGKHTLVEDIIQLFAKQSSMMDNVRRYPIFFSSLTDGEIAIAGSTSVVFPSHHVQEYPTPVGMLPVILAHTGYKAIEAMPVMYLGYRHKMNVLLRGGTVQRNTVQIDAIADTYRTLPENTRLVREGNYRLHPCHERPAKQLVNIQRKTVFERIASELGIVGIGRYLGNALDAPVVQFVKQADQYRIGIHETAGIDHFYAIVRTETVDTAQTASRLQGCKHPFAIVGNHTAIHKTALVASFIEIIIAEMNLMPILLKSLYLIADFLADTTLFGKTVIHEEQDSHLTVGKTILQRA